CLKKEPSERWQNFSDLNNELKAFRSELGFVEPVETQTKRAPNKRLYAGVSVVLIVAFLGGQQFFSKILETKSPKKVGTIRAEKRFAEVWRVETARAEKMYSTVPKQTVDVDAQLKEEEEKASRVNRSKPAAKFLAPQNTIFTEREERILRDRGHQD